MFRSPIVAIFREIFIEGYISRMSKQFANIKCQELNKSFKIYTKVAIVGP
jgi:hypothetical protein